MEKADKKDLWNNVVSKPEQKRLEKKLQQENEYLLAIGIGFFIVLILLALFK